MCHLCADLCVSSDIIDSSAVLQNLQTVLQTRVPEQVSGEACERKKVAGGSIQARDAVEGGKEAAKTEAAAGPPQGKILRKWVV